MVLKGSEGFRKVLLVSALFVAPIMMTAQTPAGDPLRPVAERYVKLVLAVGQHDGDYVDAFYGPPEWRKEAEAAKIPLAKLAAGDYVIRAIVGVPGKPGARVIRTLHKAR